MICFFATKDKTVNCNSKIRNRQAPRTDKVSASIYCCSNLWKNTDATKVSLPRTNYTCNWTRFQRLWL